MARTSAPTRTERCYTALRADILAGRHEPGTRLLFAELATRYGASMGVAREALTRLTAEGLVESEPQHGFRVVPISAEDLGHLTEARCALEALVMRQAVEHGDVAWESDVLAAHHRMERTPVFADDDPGRVSDEWAAAHAAFHAALLAACPNPRLLVVATSMRDSAELYRRWSHPLGSGSRDVAAEHRSILDAALAHDADTAVALLVAHIRRTTEILLERRA
jgi:DNA-binding GntR family transcriptional regulator